MINIAIVDDDVKSMNEMEKQIKNSKEFGNITLKIDKYNNSELLVDKLFGYDVFILDIDMPKLDGISLAKKIRRKNNISIIIFLTNRNDLMHVTFSVQPFYFIRKTNFEEDCRILLSLLKNRLDLIKKKMLFTINGRKKTVDISTIVYIESFNHYIEIHLRNDEILKLKKRLSDILLEVGTDSMIQIHKSYIVNMLYIDYLKSDMVLLTNGKSLPIGRKFKELVTKKHERYLLL